MLPVVGCKFTDFRQNTTFLPPHSGFYNVCNHRMFSLLNVSNLQSIINKELRILVRKYRSDDKSLFPERTLANKYPPSDKCLTFFCFFTDYGSEEEEEVLQHATNDYVNAELPDEGLGESDNRSYYTEDPGEYRNISE